jgi:Ca-activated chloride channel family protein
MPLRVAFVAACLCVWGSRHAQAQVRGDDPSVEIAAADRLLRDGDFEAAAAAYERSATGTLPAAAVYNHGIALYRTGQMTEAAERFQRAAAAENDSLAASARFNLGNSHYARAVAALQSQDQPDPAEAISQLEMAIDSYRSSLRIDPTDADARANIELATKLIKQLQQQQEQQEQQEQEQQQQQDQDQQSSQQNAPADDSEKAEQQDQDSESEEKQQSEPQRSETKQPPNDQSDASQSEQRSGDSQDQAEPHDQDDQQEQETPAGELTAANQSDEDASQDPAQRVAPPEALRMTDEEARKMLQAIRDRDMLRRIRRRSAERSRRIPVDRDW